MESIRLGFSSIWITLRSHRSFWSWWHASSTRSATSPTSHSSRSSRRRRKTTWSSATSASSFKTREMSRTFALYWILTTRASCRGRTLASSPKSRRSSPATYSRRRRSLTTTSRYTRIGRSKTFRIVRSYEEIERCSYARIVTLPSPQPWERVDAAYLLTSRSTAVASSRVTHVSVPLTISICWALIPHITTTAQGSIREGSPSLESVTSTRANPVLTLTAAACPVMMSIKSTYPRTIRCMKPRATKMSTTWILRRPRTSTVSWRHKRTRRGRDTHITSKFQPSLE